MTPNAPEGISEKILKIIKKDHVCAASGFTRGAILDQTELAWADLTFRWHRPYRHSWFPIYHVAKLVERYFTQQELNRKEPSRPYVIFIFRDPPCWSSQNSTRTFCSPPSNTLNITAISTLPSHSRNNTTKTSDPVLRFRQARNNLYLQSWKSRGTPSCRPWNSNNQAKTQTSRLLMSHNKA